MMIDLAERDGWLVSSDSVDGEPAWELNLLEYPAGKMAANRLRSAILNSSINTSLSGYRIYIRKYAPQTRASLAAHLDKSKLSFTASLNDDYAGGEFFYLDANDNEQTVAIKKGDVIVFGGRSLAWRQAHAGGSPLFPGHALQVVERGPRFERRSTNAHQANRRVQSLTKPAHTGGTDRRGKSKLTGG